MYCNKNFHFLVIINLSVNQENIYKMSLYFKNNNVYKYSKERNLHKCTKFSYHKEEGNIKKERDFEPNNFNSSLPFS